MAIPFVRIVMHYYSIRVLLNLNYEGGHMISEKLIEMIKENADTLTNRLCKDLLSREETKG